MAGYSNKATALINKIENRLGTKLLNLPKEIAKPTWMDEVIIPDTLVTFSRYFPNEILYTIEKATPTKDGWYLIQDEQLENVEILGIRDIDWNSFGSDNLFYQQELGYGTLDMIGLQAGMTVEDIAMFQMRKDVNSLFNQGLYIDFMPPNKMKVTSTTGANIGNQLRKFKVKLLIKHADNLVTISPTMMETFEQLAISDIAGYLYRYLKYYDNLETVYANIDLKLDELQDKMNQRDAIVEDLKEASVTASNPSCPIIVTI